MAMEKIIKDERGGPKYGKVGKRMRYCYHGQSNYIKSRRELGTGGSRL
jgi:hypothetical protein